jgi:hypothetical protein
MPGSEGEAAGLLDSYLAAQRRQADAVARGAGATFDSSAVVA